MLNPNDFYRPKYISYESATHLVDVCREHDSSVAPGIDNFVDARIYNDAFTNWLILQQTQVGICVTYRTKNKSEEAFGIRAIQMYSEEVFKSAAPYLRRTVSRDRTPSLFY